MLPHFEAANCPGCYERGVQPVYWEQRNEGSDTQGNWFPYTMTPVDQLDPETRDAIKTRLLQQMHKHMVFIQGAIKRLLEEHSTCPLGECTLYKEVEELYYGKNKDTDDNGPTVLT